MAKSNLPSLEAAIICRNSGWSSVVTFDAYDGVLFDENDQPQKIPGYRVDAYTDKAIEYISRNRKTINRSFCSSPFLNRTVRTTISAVPHRPATKSGT